MRCPARAPTSSARRCTVAVRRRVVVPVSDGELRAVERGAAVRAGLIAIVAAGTAPEREERDLRARRRPGPRRRLAVHGDERVAASAPVFTVVLPPDAVVRHELLRSIDALRRRACRAAAAEAPTPRVVVAELPAVERRAGSRRPARSPRYAALGVAARAVAVRRERELLRLLHADEGGRPERQVLVVPGRGLEPRDAACRERALPSSACAARGLARPGSSCPALSDLLPHERAQTTTRSHCFGSFRGRRRRRAEPSAASDETEPVVQSCRVTARGRGREPHGGRRPARRSETARARSECRASWL